jgi:hypothetical protein
VTVWEWLASDKGQMALGGLFGSAVNTVMEWEGIVPGIRRLFVGAVTAYFLGPVGIPLFQWAGGSIALPTDQAASVGGFITGVSGVVIVEIIMKVWKSRRRELEDR